MDKQRELKAIAKVIFILTKEVVENPTVSIKDVYRYVLREVTTPTLASEAARNDFYLRTGQDICTIDWRNSRTITSKTGEKLSIHKLYTGDHIQTCHDFKADLITLYEDGRLTEEYIIEQLNNRHVCWIMKEEDKRLNALGYKFVRPNPEKAYREAGIVICRSSINELSSSITVSKAHESQPQGRKTTTYCAKNTFTFKNEKRINKARNRQGFTALDNEGRVVAVVAMHEDKRGVAYGQAELCFYDEYVSEFGKWRLIAIDKERVSFEKLTKILEENGSYKATIDPRKGS